MIIVAAQSWRAYSQYCVAKGIDAGDRLAVIPLITGSDVHRLSPTNVRSAKVVKVGKIEEELWLHFTRHLSRNGLEVQ